MLTGEGMILQIEVAEKCLNDGTVMAASGSGKSIRKHTRSVKDDMVIVQEAWYEVLYAERRKI